MDFNICSLKTLPSEFGIGEGLPLTETPSCGASMCQQGIPGRFCSFEVETGFCVKTAPTDARLQVL